MPYSVEQPPFSARRALGSVGLLAASGVAISGLYSLTGVGVPCPWRLLTGTLCPFCGSTRLGERLLHLDPVGAWAANPFVFVLLAGIGVASVLWVVEALGGPAVRPPPRLRSQNLWYAVVGGAAVVFTVVRNWPG